MIVFNCKYFVSKIINKYSSILNISKSFHCSTRNLNKTKNLREEKFRIKDKISENYSIIYRAPMENYISFTKHFTTFSFGCIASLLCIRYYKGLKLNDLETPNFGGFQKSDEFEMVIFGIGFAAITLVVRRFINQYPLRIYKNQKSYIAILEGNFPSSRKYLEFAKGDVKPSSKGIIWYDSKYLIKNQNMLLLLNYFKTPSELHLMLKENNEPV